MNNVFQPETHRRNLWFRWKQEVEIVERGRNGERGKWKRLKLLKQQAVECDLTALSWERGHPCPLGLLEQAHSGSRCGERSCGPQMQSAPR